MKFWAITLAMLAAILSALSVALAEDVKTTPSNLNTTEREEQNRVSDRGHNWSWLVAFPQRRLPWKRRSPSRGKPHNRFSNAR